MVKYMVDNGAVVDLRGENEKTALHFAAQAPQENIDLVRFLLDRGIQAADTDTFGRSALHYASVAQNFEIAKYLLKGFFTDNEPPKTDLQRTLFEAAKGNCVKLLRYLIERGVDTHCKTFQGRAALHEAAAIGAMESINVLLEQGLNVHEADKFGVTPLLEASRHCQLDAIHRILEAGGSLDEFDLAGQTTLHLAAKGGHKKSVDLLVENGADISCYDKRGWTPLHHAASGGHVDVVKALVALDVSLECKTNAGDSAAMVAVLGGHSDVAKMLGLIETGDLGFEKYKEYRLDREGVHFNSIASTRIGIATGLWLEAPIEIMLKGQNSTSQSFVDLLNRWSRLNHPHILKLYGFCHADGNGHYFVCERAAYEYLGDSFDTRSPELMKGVWEKLYQAALGVQYLHNRDIVHGFLDVYSVALAANGVAKLHGIAIFSKKFTSTPEILAGLPPTFESDIFAFGLLIVDIITKHTMCAEVYKSLYDVFEDFDDPIIRGELPSKPNAMTSTQWNLVERMCCYNPSERPTIADVIRELESFAKNNLTSEEFSTDANVSSADLSSWADVGEVRIDQATVSSLLVNIGSMSGVSAEESVDKMQRDVYHRLVDILNQLQAQPGPPDAKVVERYRKILHYFLTRLRATRDADSSLSATLAASSQGVDDTFCLHQDIDMFADSAGLSRAEGIHQWQDQWQLCRSQQQQETLEKMEQLPSLLEEMESEKEREEVLTYLRFEISKYPTSYDSSNAADLSVAKAALHRLSTSRNPDWFIPAHEVKFDRFDELSRGSFGKVYHGQWNRSRVVVKKVELKSEEDRAAFLNEVDVWHKLFLPNMVRLYGACHTQQPFFVCELAGGGQLDHFLRVHPEELWQKLYEAALGLRYLHIKSVVHSDLKCNNILIGSDGQAQLTDFGLSNVVSDFTEDDTEPESERESSGLVGAIRWKAPEVLQGEKSTFASDIYSFGMCIIEAVSGKFPWGTLPDIAVRYHVLEKKRIPVRPDNCSKAAYSLVERMCRFDPSKRIGMNAVVDELKAFRNSH